jgi:hypothetical protein
MITEKLKSQYPNAAALEAARKVVMPAGNSFIDALATNPKNRAPAGIVGALVGPQAATTALPTMPTAAPVAAPATNSQVMSGTIPATQFAPDAPAPVGAATALPVMATPAKVSAPVSTDITGPAVIDPNDPAYREKVTAQSPFADVFGRVEQGSWDDLWNNKLIGTRAKSENLANVDAFEAASGRLNALTGVKAANDVAGIADAATANRVATENAQNATAIATNALSNSTSRANTKDEIKSRDRAAEISADAINKQAKIQPIGQHLEGPPGLQVPVTDYGMIGLDDKGGVAVTPLSGANSKSVAQNSPPPGHIAALKKDPALKADFDARYGAGAADSVLGK